MPPRAAPPRRPSAAPTKTATLLARADPSTKQLIARAARTRGPSATASAPSVLVAQARRDVDEPRTRTLVLTPEEQLAFWQALDQPPPLTPRQRDLGRLMRGDR